MSGKTAILKYSECWSKLTKVWDDYLFGDDVLEIWELKAFGGAAKLPILVVRPKPHVSSSLDVDGSQVAPEQVSLLTVVAMLWLEAITYCLVVVRWSEDHKYKPKSCYTHSYDLLSCSLERVGGRNKIPKNRSSKLQQYEDDPQTRYLHLPPWLMGRDI